MGLTVVGFVYTRVDVLTLVRGMVNLMGVGSEDGRRAAGRRLGQTTRGK